MRLATWACVFSGLAVVALAQRPAPQPVTVDLIWSTDCPVAQRWSARVAAWSARTHGPSVQVTWWFPNDASDAAREAMRRMGAKGEVQALRGSELAATVGLDRLPSAIVKDARGNLIFVGGLGEVRDMDQAKRFFVAEAVVAAQQGRTFSPSRSTPFGCTIPDPLEERPGSPITYMRDIRPMIRQFCLPCHSPGGAAPFALDSYDQARRWSHMVADVLRQGKMPPVRSYDRTTQKALSLPTTEDLEKWVIWREFGCPEGTKPASTEPIQPPRGTVVLPALPQPALGELRWVDVALPKSATPESVRGFEVFAAGSGDVRWAGLYAGPLSSLPLRTTDRGRRFRPTPSGWRLLDARVPGLARATPSDRIVLQPNEGLVLRLRLYGVEGPRWLRPSVRIVGGTKEPIATTERVQVAPGRYTPLDFAIEMFAGGQFAEPVVLTSLVPIVQPTPLESAVFVPGRALALFRNTPGFDAPMMVLERPHRLGPNLPFQFNVRHGGAMQMGDPPPTALVVGDQWNGATAELWLRVRAQNP